MRFTLRQPRARVPTVGLLLLGIATADACRGARGYVLLGRVTGPAPGAPVRIHSIDSLTAPLDTTVVAGARLRLRVRAAPGCYSFEIGTLGAVPSLLQLRLGGSAEVPFGTATIFPSPLMGEEPRTIFRDCLPRGWVDSAYVQFGRPPIVRPLPADARGP